MQNFKKQHTPGFIDKFKNPARPEICVVQDHSKCEPYLNGSEHISSSVSE